MAIRSPGAGGVVLYDASNRDWSVQHTKWTAAKQLLGFNVTAPGIPRKAQVSQVA